MTRHIDRRDFLKNTAAGSAAIAGVGVWSQLPAAESNSPNEKLNIICIGTSLDNPTRVAEVGAFSAFMWSPDGVSLVVADQAAGNAVAFERMRLISADGSTESTITEESLLAFYWSPDSSRVAWVGLKREQRSFDWNVATVSGDGAGESRSLFNFNPSRDVFTMLSFFDQYAYSHSPWSPDSSRLVMAGTMVAPFERRNGHTPTGARVFVLDATGSAPPEEIAEGTLAFWSWN